MFWWRQCLLLPFLRYCCLKLDWYYHPPSKVKGAKGLCWSIIRTQDWIVLWPKKCLSVFDDFVGLALKGLVIFVFFSFEVKSSFYLNKPFDLFLVFSFAKGSICKNLFWSVCKSVKALTWESTLKWKSKTLFASWKPDVLKWIKKI